MPIRILLADDHLIVRQGIRTLLTREGLEVVAEAATGREALRLAQELTPEVAVLDYEMPGLNGIDAAREIMRACPAARTVLLTQYAEEPYVVSAMRAGLHGYVVKTQAASDLVHAIREVHRGRLYLGGSLSQTLAGALREPAELRDDPLTLREREVLQLVAEGQSSKQIAQTLGISAKTAESHRGRIMVKLGLHEIASLVRYAIRHRLVRP
jgi:DNA-binding NarL/FixJ family response regulator